MNIAQVFMATKIVQSVRITLNGTSKTADTYTTTTNYGTVSKNLFYKVNNNLLVTTESIEIWS